MKLNLFLIILGVLLLSCLGSNIKESFDVGQDIDDIGSGIATGARNIGRGIRRAGDAAFGIGPNGYGGGYIGTPGGSGKWVGGNGRGPAWTRGGGVPGAPGVPSGGGYSATEEELPGPRRRRDNRWILRSQIVPPVCPKCPDIRTCNKTPCPACPPCGRCPEPAFKCEKVPNYNSRNDMYMPRPVLADFSQFAM